MQKKLEQNVPTRLKSVVLLEKSVEASFLRAVIAFFSREVENDNKESEEGKESFPLLENCMCARKNERIGQTRRSCISVNFFEDRRCVTVIVMAESGAIRSLATSEAVVAATASVFEVYSSGYRCAARPPAGE